MHRNPSGNHTNDRTLPRLVLADAYLVVAQGVAELLRPEYKVLKIVVDGEALVEAALREHPEIILAEIEIPGVSAIEVHRRISKSGVAIPMALLTTHAEAALVDEALSAGIRGYVLKSASAEELLQALKQVLGGGTYISASLWPGVVGKSKFPPLTPRQREILMLLASGLRSREIADQLDLSVRTVEAHRQSLMQAFHVRNGIELVREATRLGAIAPV